MSIFRILLSLAAAGSFAAPAVGLAQTPAPLPRFTAAQAKRGAEMYSGSCALCHGEHLNDGEFGPALKGQAHADYWRGKTAEDMFVYMNAMMPPASPGSLGGQAYADIFAYILQSGGGTPGDKELPTDPAALRGSAPTH